MTVRETLRNPVKIASLIAAADGDRLLPMTTCPDRARRCGPADAAPWLVAACLMVAPGWLLAASPATAKAAAPNASRPAGPSASTTTASKPPAAASTSPAEVTTAPASAAPASGARSGRGSAQAVRVLATRSHVQCPIPGKTLAVMAIDSAQEWSEKLRQDEVAIAGRPIRWTREQVLIYAMNQQPTLGVSVEPASRVLTLHSGLLMWPVREIRPGPGQMAATATSRPCLVAIVKRAFWQKIKIVRKH